MIVILQKFKSNSYAWLYVQASYELYVLLLGVYIN